MNIDNCRDPLNKAESFCRAELTEPVVPPVLPSIPHDHLEPKQSQADRKIQHIDSTLRQLDLALAVAAQAMMRCNPPLTTLILDSFAVENGPRVSIKPDTVLTQEQDKRYYVQLNQGKCGS